MIEFKQVITMFFGKIINRIGKVEISNRNMVLLEALIMVIFFEICFLVSMAVSSFVKKAGSPYINVMFWSAMVILLIYTVRSRIKASNNLEATIYANNMRNIYGLLDFFRRKEVPESITTILEMKINMFHDQMKHDGRKFSPPLAKKIRWANWRMTRALFPYS